MSKEYEQLEKVNMRKKELLAKMDEKLSEVMTTDEYELFQHCFTMGFIIGVSQTECSIASVPEENKKNLADVTEKLCNIFEKKMQKYVDSMVEFYEA